MPNLFNLVEYSNLINIPKDVLPRGIDKNIFYHSNE